MRPRRSVLYMPGANERALEKAKTLPADALILDLEDAVAPDAKVAARDRVCAAAASGDYGAREVTIRVNGIGTPWHADDLAAAGKAGPAAVVVPKVDSADEVRAIAAALPEPVEIWAMIETPVAVLHCAEIAAASERLTALVLGTNDLAKEMLAEQVPGRGTAARPAVDVRAGRAGDRPGDPRRRLQRRPRRRRVRARNAGRAGSSASTARR